MRKNLSEIYSEMYSEDPNAMFPRELLEKATVDRFALNDYSKLIYEQTNDIFNYLEELINEGSGHGDQKIVTLALKDAVKRGLVDVKETKSGWIVKSLKDSTLMETIHRGERAFHYLRRFLQKVGEMP